MIKNVKARYFQYTLTAATLFSVACSSEPPKQSTPGTGGAGGASSSSTSGSSTGGAGGSGGAGGGASVCDTALFCDDFEAFAAQGEPSGAWAVSKNKGAAVVDTTRAHSGKQSVKITTDASSSYKSVLMAYSDKLPVAANVVHGRMMMWLESAPTGTVHWTFIAGQGPVEGQNYTAIYRYGGQHPITNNGAFVGSKLMANYETNGIGSDCWHHAKDEVVPVGKWACVEWKFDGPKNEMQFWLDGAEIQTLHVQGAGQGCVHQPADFPWTAPSFEKMAIGWESYQADEARTMWIDDVVISEAPIGCP
ncbi:hypothetical protein [Polyangium aurulentum]|uniref:hypothetical protein n=1 Tax=Polyangium aurulentum TaxID=2567896 RepID=UPI0010AE90EE|nr:hypothetical protein [Polyangium aurulentum]UQA59460.1 hypothetical protein E8A73_002825 [Polyangium aurulentum]